MNCAPNACKVPAIELFIKPDSDCGKSESRLIVEESFNVALLRETNPLLTRGGPIATRG